MVNLYTEDVLKSPTNGMDVSDLKIDTLINSVELKSTNGVAFNVYGASTSYMPANPNDARSVWLTNNNSILNIWGTYTAWVFLEYTKTTDKATITV